MLSLKAGDPGVWSFCPWPRTPGLNAESSKEHPDLKEAFLLQWKLSGPKGNPGRRLSAAALRNVLEHPQKRAGWEALIATRRHPDAAKYVRNWLLKIWEACLTINTKAACGFKTEMIGAEKQLHISTVNLSTGVNVVHFRGGLLPSRHEKGQASSI